MTKVLEENTWELGYNLQTEKDFAIKSHNQGATK